MLDSDHTYTYIGKNKMTQAIIAASNALHISAILDFFRDIKRSWDHRAKVNATIKELSKLSDHELRDIGIGRSEIYSIAVEAHNND